MLRPNLFVFVFFFFIFSCAHYQEHPLDNQKEYMIGATLWYQRAAELEALSYQAYNMARLQLDLDLEFRASDLPRAIVIDIDETVLDNSPYQARLIMEGKTFSPESWDEWVREGQASPLPGAVEFLTYAHDQGVAIFYLSNRLEGQRVPTMENLQAWGIPVKDEHLLLRIDDFSKEERRQMVEQNYRVVLLIGDQLEDFSGDFDDLDLEQRREVTTRYRDEFGHRLIILPNPLYGNWEQLMYKEGQEQGMRSRPEVWLRYLVPDAL